MTISRFRLLFILGLAGCAELSPPSPANDLEASILSSDTESFQRFVVSRERKLLETDMKLAGFERLKANDDGCTQYRYDRTLDIMGQRVTAQIFDCDGKLSADIGYTFL